jgi:hypothetical protein
MRARAAGGLQLDGVAFGNVFDDLRLGVGIVLVGSGGVGDDGGIELLAEFAAQFGDLLSASFESFCAAARSWMALTASRA